MCSEKGGCLRELLEARRLAGSWELVSGALGVEVLASHLLGLAWFLATCVCVLELVNRAGGSHRS